MTFHELAQWVLANSGSFRMGHDGSDLVVDIRFRRDGKDHASRLLVSEWQIKLERDDIVGYLVAQTLRSVPPQRGNPESLMKR